MKIAIIGGSLLGDMPGLIPLTDSPEQTPYGEPSGIFTAGTVDNKEVVYLNRHGQLHNIAPHQINYRANIHAMHMLGVTHIISVTAVGGITKIMTPMRWVVPAQIIDYTYGREHTFNEYDEAKVNHIDFTYPFDDDIRSKLQHAVTMSNMMCIAKATYGVTQGPRLETITEIKRMKKEGCDIVGMTAMPEAALARELGINYATLSLVVNWAAGVHDETITMEMIEQHLERGMGQVMQLLGRVLSNPAKAAIPASLRRCCETSPSGRPTIWTSSHRIEMQTSCSTAAAVG